MMNIMRYCTIDPDGGLSSRPTVQFNLKALHQFDAVKVLLEQSLYLRYLECVDSGVNTDILKESVTEMLSLVPSKPPSSILNTLLEEYYDTCYTVARNLISNVAISSDMNLHHLLLAFAETPMQPYNNREYLPTINRSFLLQLLDLHCNFRLYEDGEVVCVSPAILYTPEIKVVQHYNPALSSRDNDDSSMIYVLNPTIELPSYIPGEPEGIVFHNATRYLCRLDYGNMTVDDLIAILTSFTVGQHKYNIDNSWRGTLPYACQSIMSRSGSGDIYAGGPLDTVNEMELNDYLNMFKYLICNGRLNKLTDYPLFGKLLECASSYRDTPLVNYFYKEAQTVTATEAYAFRESDLASFINDKLVVSLEAQDDDMLDQTEGEEPDEDAGDMEGDGMDMADGDEQPIDATPEEPVNDKPEIDPSLMLFELATRYDTLPQYIFRKNVSFRLKQIINNPPPNVSSTTILFLKRYRSRFIYLVSIPSLRDFISRVGMRLSDTK